MHIFSVLMSHMACLLSCRAGQRSRYAYAACQNAEMSGRFSGIVKFDLTASNGSAVVGKIEHGPNCFGGEAVFVPAGTHGTGAWGINPCHTIY